MSKKINLTEHIDKYGYGLILWKYNPKKNDNTKCDMIKIECKSQLEYKKKIKHYQSKNENYLFEMTGSDKYCKLFMDCDKLELNKDDCKKYLFELYDLIDTIIDKPIDHKLYYVYVKYAVDNETITSIHIINKNKIHYDYGNLLIQKLKDSKLNPITDSLDCNLFNNHRQFCLPYNTKPYNEKVLQYGYTNPLQSKDVKFVDFNIHTKYYNIQQTKNPINYSICMIDGLDEITIPNITESDKKQIDIQKSIFCDDFVDCDNRPNRLLLNKNCKDIIIPKSIELLNETFYKKYTSKDWINLVRQFKHIKCSEEQINMFLEHSTKYGDIDDYTIENNKIFYKHLTTEKCIVDSYKVISNIITKHNTDTYCYTEYLKYNVNSIIEWIHTISGIDKPSIKESFNHKVMNESEEECITITKDVKYNITTGFLFHNDKINNYNIEIQHREYDKEITEENEIHTDMLNSDIVKKEVDDFISGKTKYLSVSAKWGTGKSYNIVKPILKELQKKNSKVEDEIMYEMDNGLENEYECDVWKHLFRYVMISPTNSLNKKEITEMKNMENSFVCSHLDIQELKSQLNNCSEEMRYKLYDEINTKRKYFSMITSLESIDKSVNIYKQDYIIDGEEYEIRKNPVDLLIMDEVESILNHYESNTFNKKNTTAYQSYKYFEEIVKNAKQIIILDADISTERLQLLENIINK